MAAATAHLAPSSNSGRYDKVSDEKAADHVELEGAPQPEGDQDPSTPDSFSWGRVGLKVLTMIAVFLCVTILLELFADEQVSAASQWIMGKVGLPGLFMAVFLADGIPQPFTYVPLIFLGVKGGEDKILVFLVCALASYSAALCGYFVGRNLRSCGGDELFARLDQDYPQVRPIMERRGALGVALCALLPIPLAMATWTAGVLHVYVPAFLAAATCRAPKIAVFVMLSRGPKG